MQRPKGTKDIFGKSQDLKQYVLDVLREITRLYNISKIETPIFERSEVFVKSVGQTSDIVNKEMYYFKDKGDRQMVLRPEGTAGTIRAIAENKLYALSKFAKYYYEGPMFRYENPQKGRQRQFSQFGVEILGDKSPLLDAEVILLASTILDFLQIKYHLKINSLGEKGTREKWSKALKEYFKPFKKDLTKDSQKRLETNPMRILDDKVDSKKDFVKKAPKISDFYSKSEQAYFNDITSFLEALGMKFEIDHTLVRGLDYYSDIAFEFLSTSGKAGSQDTIIGGGRYQDLLSQMCGPDISGVGFGLGIERLINEFEDKINSEKFKKYPDVFILNISEKASPSVLGIAYMLRKSCIATEWNYQPTKLQKAFEKADKSGAKIKIIAGEKDLEKQ